MLKKTLAAAAIAIGFAFAPPTFADLVKTGYFDVFRQGDQIAEFLTG